MPDACWPRCSAANTGYCKGKSGSLHISAKELGVLLTSTIVGGELSLAPRVALSQKMLGKDGVVVCFFGDGAACEGIFHESLNLAATWQWPILYVCENNEWQAYVHRRETMPVEHIATWAAAYGMPAVTVDGNDVQAVNAAAAEALATIRATGKPPTSSRRAPTACAATTNPMTRAMSISRSLLAVAVNAEDRALLASLGDDLKFVFITSEARLKSAIRDDNPVLFFTDLALAEVPGEVPEGEHVVPLGKAAVLRAGSDVTLISYAKTVGVCLQAAEALAKQGVSAEVIDLRTLKPLDEATLLASARKTGRVIVVHEAARLCGVGAEVAAIVAEKAFGALKAPVLRLTGPDAPAPPPAGLSSRLECLRRARCRKPRCDLWARRPWPRRDFRVPGRGTGPGDRSGSRILVAWARRAANRAR